MPLPIFVLFVVPKFALSSNHSPPAALHSEMGSYRAFFDQYGTLYRLPSQRTTQAPEDYSWELRHLAYKLPDREYEAARLLAQ